MKFLFKWLNKKIQDARDHKNEMILVEQGRKEVYSQTFDHQYSIRFTKAIGGYVLEYDSMDSPSISNVIKIGERTRKVHVINNDQDLGQAIAHIILLEMMRE